MITHKPVVRIKLTLQDRDMNKGFVTFYSDWNMDAQAILSAYSSLIAAIGALSEAIIIRVVVYYDFELDNVAIAGNVREVLNVFVQSETETIHIVPIPAPKAALFEQEGPYRFIRLSDTYREQLTSFLQAVPLATPEGDPIGTTVLTGGIAE